MNRRMSARVHSVIFGWAGVSDETDFLIIYRCGRVVYHRNVKK